MQILYNLGRRIANFFAYNVKELRFNGLLIIFFKKLLIRSKIYVIMAITNILEV